MPADRQPRTGTQSIERAIALLGVFEEGPPTVSLTELAGQTRLSPSTTHRLARALCDAGFLQQDDFTERYGLGPRLVTLGARAADNLGLAAARVTLGELATDTGESVNLGVRDGDEVVVLLYIPSAKALRFDQTAGTRVPVYASAMGKALLAFDADPDAVIQSLPRLARLTGHTITSRSALRADLDDVRERGWALNDEEREIGVRTIAAPVLNDRGNATAAIAVQGPSIRLPDSVLPRLSRRVQIAAADVAYHLTGPL